MKINKYIKIFYWILISGTIFSGIFLGKILYDDLIDTSVWEKSSIVKIAEEEPYVLYLTKKDRQTLKSYTEKLNKLYDKTKGNFVDTATYELFQDFQKDYNNLPDSLKEKEKYYYNLIMSLYPLNRESKLIFNSNNGINANVTISTLKTFIEKSGPIVKEQLDNLEDKSEKQFSNNIYNLIHNISNDLYTIDNMLSLFNKNYTIQSNSVYVKKDVSSSDVLNQWNILINQLNYKWEIVDNFLVKIIDKSKPILLSHDNQIQKINNYTIEVENLNTFNKFVEDYNNMIKNDIIEVPELKTKEDLDKYKDKITFIIKEEYSDTIEKDKIISQYPTKNEYVKMYINSIIEVVVSKGKEPEPTPPSSTSQTSSSSNNTSSSSTETTQSTTITGAETNNGNN